MVIDMKFKLCLLIIVVCVVYCLLPIGEYGITDVDALYTDSRNSTFQSLKVDEFIYQTKKNTNPEVGYIVHPNVAMTRDGVVSDKGVLTITSGWIRTGSFQTGAMHKALDTVVGGVKNINSCPAAGHGYECGDTVLIAPVSGTIEVVVSNAGKEDEYYQDFVHNSEIRIKAEGELEGYYIRILHLANIPSNFKPGYKIKQGEYIGTQCAQGLSSGSHVHMDVLNGVAEVHLNEWFNNLMVHSSIQQVVDDTGMASRDRQGWDASDIDELNEREKYDSEVVIPDANRVGGFIKK